MRSTIDHLKCVALAADIPQRLQNPSSFRKKAEELSTILPPELQHRPNIIHFSSPQLQLNTSREWQIAGTVPGINSRADDTNLKRRCSLNTVASYQNDYTI